MQNKSDFKIGLNSILGMVLLVFGFIALWFIAKSVFAILAWAAPFLIIGALLVNHRTVINYIRFVWDMLFRNWLMGIVLVLLTIFGFPIVSGFLFAKSFLDRKVQKIVKEQEKQIQGEYVEYEDVTEEEEKLELPPIEKERKRNEYDDFFSDSSS
jgi:hypothetical protein